MKSNPTITSAFASNASKLGVKYLTEKELEKYMASGSTDMGNVSYEVPSIHPMFYIGGDKNIHTREFAEMTGIYELIGDCN